MNVLSINFTEGESNTQWKWLPWKMIDSWLFIWPPWRNRHAQSWLFLYSMQKLQLQKIDCSLMPWPGHCQAEFWLQFICASIAIMKILVLRIKKCLFLRCLSLFIYFHTYITHLSSKEFKIKGAVPQHIGNAVSFTALAKRVPSSTTLSKLAFLLPPGEVLSHPLLDCVAPTLNTPPTKDRSSSSVITKSGKRFVVGISF